jgi:hypothetical protein
MFLPDFEFLEVPCFPSFCFGVPGDSVSTAIFGSELLHAHQEKIASLMFSLTT